MKLSYIILIIGAGMIIGGYSLDYITGEIIMQDLRENFDDYENFEDIIDEKYSYTLILGQILFIIENVGYLVLIAGGIIFEKEIRKKRKLVG